MDIGDAGMVERPRLRDGDDEDHGEVGDLGESTGRTDVVRGPLTISPNRARAGSSVGAASL